MDWKVLILTEASKKIGYGHYFRCMSLYQEANDRNLRVDMMVRDLEQDIFNNPNIILTDWESEEVLDSIINGKYTAVIVDSYRVKSETYSILYSRFKEALYIIDDNNLQERFSGGTIINPMFGSDRLGYDIDNKNFRYLLGIDYTMIRKDFRNCPNKIFRNVEVNTILVMLGGTDVLNYSPKIVKSLLEVYPKAKIILVNAFYTSDRVEMVSNLTANEIVNYLHQSDFCVIGAGQSIFEMISTSTPFVAVKIAENQNNNIKMLGNLGIGLVCEDIEKISELLKIIDNEQYRSEQQVLMNKYKLNGPEKIITDVLLSHLNLEKASLKYCEDVYRLAVSEDVRKVSLNNEVFSYEEHCKWYKNAVRNKDSDYFLIIEKISKTFLGQIRLEYKEGKRAYISLSFTSDLRGMRLAAPLLNNLIEKISMEKNTVIFEAVVLEDNEPSLKLFEKLNFFKTETKTKLIKFEKNISQ